MARTLQRARVRGAKASLCTRSKSAQRILRPSSVNLDRILEGPGYEATPIRGSPEHHDRFSSVGILCAAASTGTSANWPLHNLDLAGSRFSTLDQINTSNVAALVPRWLFQHGVIDGVSNQTTPVVVDGVMYVTDSRGSVYAVDAADGHRVDLRRDQPPRRVEDGRATSSAIEGSATRTVWSTSREARSCLRSMRRPGSPSRLWRQRSGQRHPGCVEDAIPGRRRPSAWSSLRPPAGP